MSNKFFYTLVALALFSILGLGGYYFYLRGSPLPTAKKTTQNITPTPQITTKRSEVTDNTDIGSCTSLKENKVVSRIEVAEYSGKKTVIGSMNGKIASLTISGTSGRFDLVPKEEGESLTLSLNEKPGLVEDANGKDIGLKGLANDAEVVAQFNCFPKKETDNIVITRVVVNKL